MLSVLQLLQDTGEIALSVAILLMLLIERLRQYRFEGKF
jgi:hypothetical protein